MLRKKVITRGSPPPNTERAL